MDTNLLLSFITDNTSEERNSLMFKALSLIDEISTDTIYSDIENILLTDTLTTTDAKLDTINSYITKELISILELHFIHVDVTTPLTSLLALVETISLVQNTEDYAMIQSLLYGSDDVIEVITSLAGTLTDIDKYKLLPYITQVGDGVLKTFREFIDSKIQEEPEALNDVEDIKNFILLYGDKNITCVLLKSGIPIGESLSFYLPFVEEDVQLSLEEITVNVLGLILLTNVKLDTVIDVYKEYSDSLIGDLDSITKVEHLLIEMVHKLKIISHE